jgi:ATP-dependent DNA helicase RecQ
MLACGDDLTVLENFIYSDTPSPRALGNLIDRVLRLGEDFDISLYDLSVSCDIRTSVIATLLAYLETEGTLEATGTFYQNYRVRLLRSREQVTAGFPPAEKKLLNRVLDLGKPGRSWLVFEPTAIAAELGVSRGKITAALSALEAAGDATLSLSGVRQGYRMKKDPGDLHALANHYAELFQRREQADLARLQQVLGLASHRGCLTGYLTAHFGEKLPHPCGHCDRCRGVSAKVVKRPTVRSAGDDDWESIRSLVREKHSELGSPRQLARFLCGMSSPAGTRARLGRHNSFGLLSDLPFADVLAIAESASGARGGGF